MRAIRWIIGLGVLAVFAAAAAFALVVIASGRSPGDTVRSLIAQIALAGRADELETPFGSDDRPRRFEVAFGDTPTSIGQGLQALGVIGDAELFVDYARAEGLDTQFQAGIYFVRQTHPLTQIAGQLTDARGSHIPFRMLAGWRLEEVAQAIDNTPAFNFAGGDFLAAASAPSAELAARFGLPPGAGLEGFLGEGTYQFPPDVTVAEVRDALAEGFLSALDALILADLGAQGFSLYEAVTLASIVQREAVQQSEMPLIAGVYRNRLDIGMKLDADPTVQYALGNSRGSWWPRITAADYNAVVSSYNTYLIGGLPPGPINSPGLLALRAVVYPQASEYYYFRADCRDDGFHDFAPTYEEHLANGC
ncbi:MAG: endolytic transglycosylase MltG [Chloroflexi bacterium]|nr:endolytic transglycosylase MltG [Chloroflexota bacterium]